MVFRGSRRFLFTIYRRWLCAFPNMASSGGTPRTEKSQFKRPLWLLPLDKTIVFHFYDFVLVLSVVFSRCQLYSVSLSQRKLIPNSALFILPFREFYAWVSTKDGFGARPAKTRYPRSIESFSFEWNTHRERDYDKGSWCPSFRVGLPSIILIETQRGQVRSSEGFRCHFRANSRRLRR